MRVFCIRVSLLDVMEGMGHYNAALVQTGRNASESADKESYDERADQVIISGTVGSGERDEWLSTASYFAEETAVSIGHKGSPCGGVRFNQLHTQSAIYFSSSVVPSKYSWIGNKCHCGMNLALACWT